MSGGGVMSRLCARISWALLKRERVGADELGNVYFRKLEKNPDGEGEDVEKRFVKYAADPDPTALPAEWHQYLHRSRATPPTAEDIARGQHQRVLFKQRVAEVEAEEARRRFQEQAAGGKAGGPGVMQQLEEGEGAGPR